MYFYHYLHPKTLAMVFDPFVVLPPIAMSMPHLFEKKFFIPFTADIDKKIVSILDKLEFTASFFVFYSDVEQYEQLSKMDLSAVNSLKANFIFLGGYLPEAIRLIQDSDGILCLDTNPTHILHTWLVASLMNKPLYLLDTPDSVATEKLKPEIQLPFSYQIFGKNVAHANAVTRQDILHQLNVTAELNEARLNQTEVVSILFWGRSGSLFIQSLLDSHFQLLSTPAASMYSYYQSWDPILLRLSEKQKEHPSLSLDDFICLFLDVFNQAFPSLFYAEPDTTGCNLNKLGDNQDDIISVDFLKFKDLFLLFYKKNFGENLELSRKKFFLLIHYCYEAALGRDISPKRTIVFQLHIPDNITLVAQVLEDFPNMRFIGMMREPIRGLHSHLRMYCVDQRNGRHGNSPQPNYDYHDLVYDGSYMRYIAHQLTGWSYLKANYPNTIYEQPLERLHAQPEIEMRQLAEWLGIEWDACLLQSTFNGLKYWGDMHANQVIQGFSTQHPLSNSWEEHFTYFDKTVLNFLLKDHLARMHYKTETLSIHWFGMLALLFPTKLEAMAFRHAFKNGMKTELQDTILVYIARVHLYLRAFFQRSLYEKPS